MDRLWTHGLVPVRGPGVGDRWPGVLFQPTLQVHYLLLLLHFYRRILPLLIVTHKQVQSAVSSSNYQPNSLLATTQLCCSAPVSNIKVIIQKWSYQEFKAIILMASKQWPKRLEKSDKKIVKRSNHHNTTTHKQEARLTNRKQVNLTLSEMQPIKFHLM